MKRYFEHKLDGHFKFWEISYTKGNLTFNTRWGPINTTGSVKQKDFSPWLTEQQKDIILHKLIEQKLIKGYVEISKKDPEDMQQVPAYLEIW